jgi:hypothetical protein
VLDSRTYFCMENVVEKIILKLTELLNVIQRGAEKSET